MEGLKKGILVKNNVAVGAVGDKYFSSTAIGVIQAFSGTTIPHGYLLADGASYKVADYPDLYAVIGNTYGGDSANFNVPNLVDKFIQGSTTSGEEKEAGLPNITGTFYHDINAASSLSGAFFSYTRGRSQNLKNDDPVKNSGYINFNASKSNSIYGKSTTVQPPALTMVYIIKAFHTNEGVDSGVSNDVVNYVNDSLVDKQDFRIFKSLEEFNEKKGTSFTVVSGVDNMVDIANAMSEGDMLIITIKYNTGSEIYFGLDSSTGWTKIFTFIKANGLCDVECRTTLPSTFKRVLNVDGVIGTWQELATMDKVVKYPDWSNQQTISLTKITVDQDVYIELNQLNSSPIEDLKINGKVASVSDSENGLYSTRFSGYVKKGSSVSYPYLTNPNIVRVFPLV